MAGGSATRAWTARLPASCSSSRPTGATARDPPRNVTRFATYNGGVTWSRTGNKLAFISQRKGTSFSAYVLSLQKPARFRARSPATRHRLGKHPPARQATGGHECQRMRHLRRRLEDRFPRLGRRQRRPVGRQHRRRLGHRASPPATSSRRRSPGRASSPAKSISATAPAISARSCVGGPGGSSAQHRPLHGQDDRAPGRSLPRNVRPELAGLERKLLRRQIPRRRLETDPHQVSPARRRTAPSRKTSTPSSP